MTDFYLIFHYDIIFVLSVTTIYLIHSFTRKIKTDRYIKFCLIFLTGYYLICYILSYKMDYSDIRGIAKDSFLPILSLTYWVVPFKKNKKINKYLLILNGAYLIFFLLPVVWHYFSDM